MLETLFHGTHRSFDRFQLNEDGLIFFAPTLEQAWQFGHRHDRGMRQVRIIEAEVDLGGCFSPTDCRSLVLVEDLVDFELLARQMHEFSTADFDASDARVWFRRGDWQALERAEVVRSLRECGFNSMRVQELGEESFAVFDPSQVVSVIADDWRQSQRERQRASSGA